MPTATLLVNRAPVLTLWAAIVAQRLGHGRATALTLGKAVAGLNAQSKGRRLGIFEAPRSKKPPPSKRKMVLLLGRAVPVVKTPTGLRAVIKGKPESPTAVERYLARKIGRALPEVEAAMRQLAKAHRPKRLAAIAFELYEQFRPKVPEDVKGWGAKGKLTLAKIRDATAQGSLN